MNYSNQTPRTIIQEYSEYSTVAGLVYIFMKDQKFLGQIFWTLIVVSLLGAGVYGSIFAYNDWKDHPVVTSVTTTGYPIRNISFPAVTICTQGYLEEILFAALFKAYEMFLQYQNQTSFRGLPYPAIQMATFYEKKFSENRTSEDNARIDEITNFVKSNWSSFASYAMPNVSIDLLNKIFIEDLISITGVLLSSNPETGLRQNTIEDLIKDKNLSVLELLLDPTFQSKIDQEEKVKTDMIKTIFQTIDMQKAFATYFKTLWYATLPCFDIQNLTSTKNGTTAMLQQCKWKGQPVSCSAIFTTFPTDSGMCCEFHLVKADQLFRDSEYTSLVTSLQNEDKMNAFTNGTEPREFLDSPFPEQGTGHGLWVLLDSHSNLLAPRSVFSDLVGFDVLVGSTKSFPFVKKKSIQVRPGHMNSIALSATAIEADDQIRDVDPDLRGCKFEDETDDLKFHKIYSQTNCFLECAMFAAQKKLQAEDSNNRTCTPWYLPFEGKNHFLCDPWDSAKFEQLAQRGREPGECGNCLPDCRRTIYHSRLSVLPLGKCDERNFGMTDLCDIGNARYLTQPHIFGQQVLDEFRLGLKKDPDYLQVISSNIRTKSTNHIQTFHFINQTYNAFERDIAELEIYFEVETVLKFETTMKMTWIDFLSTVGGLLGLCVGLSVVTVVELVWLAMRIVMNFFELRKIKRRSGSKIYK